MLFLRARDNFDIKNMIEEYHLIFFGGGRINILLLGANGFIGSAILDELSKDNYLTIACITRKPVFDKLEADNVNWLHLDVLSNKSRFQRIINESDIVINTIGELDKPALMTRTNFKLVKKIVDLMLASRGKKRLIQVSSVGCYGAINRFIGQEITIKEDDAEYPIGLYEETKTKADTYIKENLTGSDRCSYSILRPTNVFGPGMKSKAILGLAFMVKKGRFFYIADRSAVSTYVHVQDVAQAVKCVCDELEKSSNQTYIVSDDCLQQIFINTLADSLSVKKPMMVVPMGLVKLGTFFGQKLSSNFPLSDSKVMSLTSKVTFCNKKLVKLGYLPGFSIYKPRVMHSILQGWSLK